MVIAENLVGATAGSMRALRISVNCLAVVVGLFGAVFVVVSLMLLLGFASGTLPKQADQTSKGILIFFSASYAFTAILGYLVARSAWKHLRKPDLPTANYILGLASFFLGLQLYQLAARLWLSPRPDGMWGYRIEGFIGLGVVIGCYLFYRLVLKRIAARAFPAGAPPATPASISAS